MGRPSAPYKTVNAELPDKSAFREPGLTDPFDRSIQVATKVSDGPVDSPWRRRWRSSLPSPQCGRGACTGSLRSLRRRAPALPCTRCGTHGKCIRNADLRQSPDLRPDDHAQACQHRRWMSSSKSAPARCRQRDRRHTAGTARVRCNLPIRMSLKDDGSRTIS